MRIEGLSEQEAYEIITSAKEAATGSRFFETPKDDIIAEVLDGVVGWCSSDCHIWSSDFDAKRALSELEGAAAEPAASPNGGPAGGSGNSGVGSGPPSVS